MVLDREKVLQGLSKKKTESTGPLESCDLRMLPRGDFLASVKEQLSKNPDLKNKYSVRVPRHLRPKKGAAPLNSVRNLIRAGCSKVALRGSNLNTHMI